jgi:anaerobic selenocysteine-containing dehydrogenase
LARDDLFTVVHERFMTDTARYADIVLPACTSLETADIYRSYGHYGIQRCRPVIPAVGQSKSNWDTFALLAEGMGFDDPFFRQSAEDLITRLLDDLVAKHPELDRSLLDEGKAVELATPATDRFVTPSGKIEILNHRLEEPLPRYLPPQRDSFPLQLMTPPALQTLNSSFMERDDLRAGTAAMALQMNPRDASERDLQDGRRVCAFNRHGAVTFVLAITDRVPAGVVVAEGVWWIEFAPGERSVNALISQRLSDLGGGSTFYDNRVEVKAEE